MTDEEFQARAEAARRAVLAHIHAHAETLAEYDAMVSGVAAAALELMWRWRALGESDCDIQRRWHEFGEHYIEEHREAERARREHRGTAYRRLEKISPMG